MTRSITAVALERTAREALQSKVTHATWGDGTVMRYEDDRIVVPFDDVGYRTLSLEAVAARGLLEPLEATA